MPETTTTTKTSILGDAAAQQAAGASDADKAKGTGTDKSKGADAGDKGADAVKSEADKAAASAAEKAASELAAQPFSDVAKLKLAEGLKLDDALSKDFVPLAQKLGLTNAQAQALIEFSANTTKASTEARAAVADASAKKAVEALKSDKEIGGANFEKSMKLAGLAINKFGGAVDPKTGTSELREAMGTLELADGSMLGDSPVFAKFLVNVGKTLSEDSVGDSHTTTETKTAANDEETFLRSLYKHPKSQGLVFKK